MKKIVNESLKQFREKSDPIVDLGVGINKREPQFNYKKVERKINQLKKLGYMVKKELKGNKDIGYYYYWTIGIPGYKNHIGIGYSFVYIDTSDYFYHNTHSGPIEKPRTDIGSVWNVKGEKTGPAGWYTFDDKYILGVIDDLVKSANQKKKDIESKF